MDPKLLQQLIESNVMLAQAIAGQQKVAQAQARGPGYLPMPMSATKHSSDMINMPPTDLSTPAGVTEHRPLYDIEGTFGGFFQDGSLHQALLNLVVFPINGLGNELPVRPNNILDDKHGFLVRARVDDDTNYSESDDPCGPATPLVSDYDFMKWSLPYGKLARSISTIDVKNLILKAQMRQYDDFYVFGQWRGVPGTMGPSLFTAANGEMNTGLIRAAALRRKMADLGQYFQKWVLGKVWTGDPANTAGQHQTIEPYGLYRLINGEYSSSGLPITTTHRQGGPVDEDRMKNALSSLVWDAQSKVVGDGTWSLWRQLLDMEEIIYQRAASTGMLPVTWKIYMITPLWDEIVKHLACEMVADGCTIPGGGIDKVLNYNDGGLALFNLQARQQLQNSMALTLNGRTYPVVLDDTMPYEKTVDGEGRFTGYKGDIFFIPFSVAGGEQVLFWEYIDYSQIAPAIAALPDVSSNMAQGWSDSGRYYHTVTSLRNCVELQTEMQLRLIFRTPHLAARIDNVVVQRQYQLPMYWDGAGDSEGWLIPPAA